jgi:predicted RNA methylase
MKATRISEEVLEVLGEMSTDGLVAYLPKRTLDRSLYLQVNKVLAALGGKWKGGKVGGHVFDDDPAERLDLAIVSGQVERPEDFGFFETPKALAGRLVELSGLCQGESVLEPSAGTGRLIDAALAAGAGRVVGVELLERNFKVLMEKYKAWPSAVLLHFGDFLPYNTGVGCFDRVIMNPPFAKRADIFHVTAAHRFLRPGGVLAAVMSAGVLFREDFRGVDFRSFVRSKGGSIERLPEGSFKESGTMVNTAIVRIPA